jgi:FkbM family methyltransferase
MGLYRKFKKVVSGIMIKRREFLKFESHHYQNKDYNFLPDTYRVQIDKDDAWLIELFKHHSSFFDIGCNVGFIGFLAKTIEASKPVLLVDPNPLALSKASANLIANNFTHNTSFYPAFVSDKTGDIVKFYTIGSGEAGSMFSSHAETAAAHNSFIQVNTTTIDVLVDMFGYIPSLVKVDTEGAESWVLQGAKQTASKKQTTFFVEMHKNQELTMLDNATKVLNWCKEVGYQAHYMKTKEAFDDPQVIADRGKCHLLLLPHGQAFPDYLKTINENEKVER